MSTKSVYINGRRNDNGHLSVSISEVERLSYHHLNAHALFWHRLPPLGIYPTQCHILNCRSHAHTQLLITVGPYLHKQITDNRLRLSLLLRPNLPTLLTVHPFAYPRSPTGWHRRGPDRPLVYEKRTRRRAALHVHGSAPRHSPIRR